MLIRRFPRFALLCGWLLSLALLASGGAEPFISPAVALVDLPGVSAIPMPLEVAVPDLAPQTMEPPTEVESSDPLLNEGVWNEAVSLPESPSPFSPALPPYPVELNLHVQRFLDLFQSAEKRGVVERWLHKSGRYLGMIREVFRQKGLPEELAFTAMVESGFNPVAVSRAGAKGLWQFMEPTARRYGLKVDRWVDERLDPLKSTSAAADYLRDLFSQFGSWFLAQAAYNAGEVRVARAVQSSQSEDFWTIVRGRLLKEETRQFVPAIQAATLIAREPERYGFEVTPALPEPFEVVTVPFSLELHVLAKLGELSAEVLRGLNPELLRSATPPGDYSLKVPQGSGERIREGLERLSDGSRWGIHRVRGRQSLQELAGLYRTSPRRLEEINGLTETTLDPGTELVVPIPPRARALASRSSAARESGQSVHVVRPGETLSGIARQHRVTLEEILRWNSLSETTRIYPGNRLRMAESSAFPGAAPPKPGSAR